MVTTDKRGMRSKSGENHFDESYVIVHKCNVQMLTETVEDQVQNQVCDISDWVVHELECTLVPRNGQQELHKVEVSGFEVNADVECIGWMSGDEHGRSVMRAWQGVARRRAGLMDCCPAI